MIEIKNLTLGFSAIGRMYDDINKVFPDTPLVFRDLSLTIEPGHVYGLIGRNGAGKTTLMNCMCGLLGTRKVRKTVSIDGHEVNVNNPTIIVKLFHVPDSIPSLHVTARAYASTLNKLYPNFSIDCYYDCMEQFQMNQDKFFDEMSLGQKKMLFLSLAFAADTPYIILDEPTNGLDISARRVFRKMVASKMTDQKAIIISTHHINEISNLLDHILILDKNRIVFDHSVAETGSRLSFVESDNDADLDNAIYSMSSAYGKRIILPNTTGNDSEIDYELLYEAVLEDYQSIENVFTNNN